MVNVALTNKSSEVSSLLRVNTGLTIYFHTFSRTITPKSKFL